MSAAPPTIDSDPLLPLRGRISGFAIDHRRVAPGTVFGAFRGARVNGEDFIGQAVASGAIAIVSAPGPVVPGHVLHLTDEDPRGLFARLAAPFHAPWPATCVAVTGTNGKTSTVELTRQIWRLMGHSAASLGTLGVTTGNDRDKAGAGGLTTPDIVTFQSVVGGLAREGVTHLAYEASSHGLDQHRSEGPDLAAAAFTNLSRDHLDYHASMEAYFAAKARLFCDLLPAGRPAIVWADAAGDPDGWGQKMAAAARAAGRHVLGVGPDGDMLRLVERVPTTSGQTLLVEAEGGCRHRVALPLIGAYQAANALVAAGLVMASGEGEAAPVLAALQRVSGVRGRLERAAATAEGAAVYVDYAHTPDALAAAVAALRPHTPGRLILLFGCGGDRDRGKRPEMGRIAVETADVVIVTDDNPRTEAASAIRAEVMAGAVGAREIAGRAEAIGAAIAEAGPGDMVLLAGKGHEQGQIIGTEVLPFDDAEVARAAVAAAAGRRR